MKLICWLLLSVPVLEFLSSSFVVVLKCECVSVDRSTVSTRMMRKAEKAKEEGEKKEREREKALYHRAKGEKFSSLSSVLPS